MEDFLNLNNYGKVLFAVKATIGKENARMFSIPSYHIRITIECAGSLS